MINRLEEKYMKVADELFATDERKQKAVDFLRGEFEYLRSFTKDFFTSF